MFDIGGGELLVIGIVALVVIGPKELPGLLRTAGNAMGKVRRMAAEFRGQFDDAMREAELDEAKKAFTSMDETARSATTGFNPLDTIRNEIKAVKEEMKGPQDAGASAAGSDVKPAVAADPVIDLPPPEAAPPVVMPVEAPVETASEPAPKPKRARKPAKDAAGSAA